MKHLKKYESSANQDIFSEDEIVKVNGKSGRISAIMDDHIYVYIFKEKKTSKFDKSDVTKVKRCKAACNKKQVVQDGKRVIYCDACDRTFP